MPLYKSLVFIQWHCVQFQSPHPNKDTVELEELQRRAKMMKVTGWLPLGIFSRKQKPLRGDRVEFCKS